MPPSPVSHDLDSERKRRRASRRAGVRAGIPFAVAAGVLAVSFGVLAEPAIGAGPALAMSALVFAGSAQFGSVAVLASGGGLLTAITTGCLLNTRYIPMGIALASSLRGGPPRRALYGEAMIDASWAMASRGGGRFDPDFMVGATLPSYPAWVGGTALGVFAGDLIADPATLGLDALFPAFFLVLLVGEIRTRRRQQEADSQEAGDEARRAIAVAAIAAALALVLLPVSPPGVPVIAASAAALLGLRGRPPAQVGAEARDPMHEAEEGP